MISALLKASEAEPEFISSGVLFVVVVLVIAVMQLAGGPTSVIRSGVAAPRASPLSVQSLLKGSMATLRAIQLTSVIQGSSLTAKLLAGAFPISFLGFAWLPKTLGWSPVTPAHVGLLGDDLVNLNVQRLLSKDFLCRSIFSLFFVCPLKNFNFFSIFYWIAYTPFCFYLLITLLDGAFIGGNYQRMGVTDKFKQLIGNLCLIILGNVFSASCAINFNRHFPALQLPTDNLVYGAEPLIIALFILLVYRNPVSLLL